MTERGADNHSIVIGSACYYGPIKRRFAQQNPIICKRMSIDAVCSFIEHVFICDLVVYMPYLEVLADAFNFEDYRKKMSMLGETKVPILVVPCPNLLDIAKQYRDHAGVGARFFRDSSFLKSHRLWERNISTCRNEFRKLASENVLLKIFDTQSHVKQFFDEQGPDVLSRPQNFPRNHYFHAQFNAFVGNAVAEMSANLLPST